MNVNIKNNTARIYQLNKFKGEMEKITIKLPKDFPYKALNVDDWYFPAEGDLCLNGKGEIDVVKKITWEKPTYYTASHSWIGGGLMYHFNKSKKIIPRWQVVRLEVKKGKRFIFEGNVYVPREPLCGGYIEKLAQNGKIDKYEYGEFE